MYSIGWSITPIYYSFVVISFSFFFQAEDGIRDLVRSRGLGDVYKRQAEINQRVARRIELLSHAVAIQVEIAEVGRPSVLSLSLIHI